MTTNLDKALLLCGRNRVVLKLCVESALDLGASVRFLSVFPDEEEGE